MCESEKRVENDLPKSVAYLDEGMRLAERCSASVICSENDHFGIIAVSSLRKLMEQARSVKVLIANGQGRDAQLVARSMMETMVYTLWIAQDPDTRVSKWHGFLFVEDWRSIRKQKAEGVVIDRETEKEINNFLRKHGHKYEDRRKSGKPDPYHSNWRCRKQVKQFFDEVKGELLYQQIYGLFSDWIHSGPKALARAISWEGKVMKWNPAPPSSSVVATCVAFQCVVQVLQSVVKHFGAGFTSEIQDLIAGYKKEFLH